MPPKGDKQNKFEDDSKSRSPHIPADFRQTIVGMQGEMSWHPMFTGSFEGWLANKSPIPQGQTPNGWEIIGEDGLVGEDT